MLSLTRDGLLKITQIEAELLPEGGRGGTDRPLH